MDLTTKQLRGLYGAFKGCNYRKYQAIAVGRMLIHRGDKPPKHFNRLLEWAQKKQHPAANYSQRIELLAQFGIVSYRQYLESELWAVVRKLVLTRDRGRCNFCDRGASQVHHVSYDIATLCGALLDRLHSTCRDCHRCIEFDDNDRKRTFWEAVTTTMDAEDKRRGLYVHN